MKIAQQVSSEEWRPYPGTQLEVSNRGNLRSLAWGVVKPRKLQVQNGHPYIYWLDERKRPRGRRVAAMVLELFVGPAPAGCVPAHADGDFTNCRTTNLSWRPPSVPTRGTGRRLSDVERQSIAHLVALGRAQPRAGRYWTVRRIAERLGVSPVTVWRVGSQ